MGNIQIRFPLNVIISHINPVTDKEHILISIFLNVADFLLHRIVMTFPSFLLGRVMLNNLISQLQPSARTWTLSLICRGCLGRRAASSAPLSWRIVQVFIHIVHLPFSRYLVPNIC